MRARPACTSCTYPNVLGQQTSQAVSAGLDTIQALTRLLKDTGLQFEFLTANSVGILAIPDTTGPWVPDSIPSYLPEVIVTGSRIPLPPNLAAVSAVHVVTAQDIDRIPGEGTLFGPIVLAREWNGVQR